MNRGIFILLVAIPLLCMTIPSTAEIYKWTDEHGIAHFTDKPPAGKKTETLVLKINTYTAVEVTPLVERLGRKDKVVIYTTAWCGICKQAKKYFRDNNIAYVSYDVEKSRIGRTDFKLLKGRSVPIILLGGKRMNGFTVARFDALYKQVQKQQTQAMNTEQDGG